jgi:hypothetical protein
MGAGNVTRKISAHKTGQLEESKPPNQAVTIYLREIGQIPLLTPLQEFCSQSSQKCFSGTKA